MSYGCFKKEPWLVKFILQDNPSTTGQRLQVIKYLQGPLEDGGVIKEVADGVNSIAAIFTGEAVHRWKKKAEENEEDAEDFDGTIIVKQYCRSHINHPDSGRCVFILHVDDFELWDSFPGFCFKSVALQNCMAVPAVQRKSIELWHQLNTAGSESHNNTSLSSVALSQLLSLMGESSQTSPKYSNTEVTRGSPSLSLDLTASRFLIAENEKKILDGITEWQPSFCPNPSHHNVDSDEQFSHVQHGMNLHQPVIQHSAQTSSSAYSYENVMKEVSQTETKKTNSSVILPNSSNINMDDKNNNVDSVDEDMQKKSKNVCEGVAKLYRNQNNPKLTENNQQIASCPASLDYTPVKRVAEEERQEEQRLLQLSLPKRQSDSKTCTGENLVHAIRRLVEPEKDNEVKSIALAEAEESRSKARPIIPDPFANDVTFVHSTQNDNINTQINQPDFQLSPVQASQGSAVRNDARLRRQVIDFNLDSPSVISESAVSPMLRQLMKPDESKSKNVQSRMDGVCKNIDSEIQKEEDGNPNKSLSESLEKIKQLIEENPEAVQDYMLAEMEQVQSQEKCNNSQITANDLNRNKSINNTNRTDINQVSDTYSKTSIENETKADMCNKSNKKKQSISPETERLNNLLLTPVNEEAVRRKSSDELSRKKCSQSSGENDVYGQKMSGESSEDRMLRLSDLVNGQDNNEKDKDINRESEGNEIEVISSEELYKRDSDVQVCVIDESENRLNSSKIVHVLERNNSDDCVNVDSDDLSKDQFTSTDEEIEICGDDAYDGNKNDGKDIKSNAKVLDNQSDVSSHERKKKLPTRRAKKDVKYIPESRYSLDSSAADTSVRHFSIENDPDYHIIDDMDDFKDDAKCKSASKAKKLLGKKKSETDENESSSLSPPSPKRGKKLDFKGKKGRESMMLTFDSNRNVFVPVTPKKAKYSADVMFENKAVSAKKMSKGNKLKKSHRLYSEGTSLLKPILSNRPSKKTKGLVQKELGDKENNAKRSAENPVIVVEEVDEVFGGETVEKDRLVGINENTENVGSATKDEYDASDEARVVYVNHGNNVNNTDMIDDIQSTLPFDVLHDDIFTDSKKENMSHSDNKENEFHMQEDVLMVDNSLQVSLPQSGNSLQGSVQQTEQSVNEVTLDNQSDQSPHVALPQSGQLVNQLTMENHFVDQSLQVSLSPAPDVSDELISSGSIKCSNESKSNYAVDIHSSVVKPIDVPTPSVRNVSDNLDHNKKNLLDTSTEGCLVIDESKRSQSSSCSSGENRNTKASTSSVTSQHDKFDKKLTASASSISSQVDKFDKKLIVLCERLTLPTPECSLPCYQVPRPRKSLEESGESCNLMVGTKSQGRIMSPRMAGDLLGDKAPDVSTEEKSSSDEDNNCHGNIHKDLINEQAIHSKQRSVRKEKMKSKEIVIDSDSIEVVENANDVQPKAVNLMFDSSEEELETMDENKVIAELMALEDTDVPHITFSDRSLKLMKNYAL